MSLCPSVSLWVRGYHRQRTACEEVGRLGKPLHIPTKEHEHSYIKSVCGGQGGGQWQRLWKMPEVTSSKINTAFIGQISKFRPHPKNKEESLKGLSNGAARFDFQFWKLIQVPVHKINSKGQDWKQGKQLKTVLRWWRPELERNITEQDF